MKPDNYVEINDRKIAKVKASPVLIHLSKSGIGIEALINLTGLAKARVLKFLRQAETPDPFECYILDAAFKYAQGTFLEEYTIWDYGAYQSA